MNHIRRFCLCSVLSILLSLALSVSTASAFNLTGTVSDADGNLLGSANVTAIDTTTSSTADTDVTGVAGDYALSVVAGVYDLTVTPAPASGLSSATVFDVAVTQDTVVDIVLAPAGQAALSGFLRDRNGTPVPNQLIRLLGPINVAATTAGDGSFSLVAAPDTYTVGVRRSGAAGSSDIPDNFDLFGPSVTLTLSTVQDLTLETVHLDVSVVDPNGVPVPGASIDVGCVAPSFELFPGGTTGGGVCGAATTDAFGFASVSLFPADPVSFTVMPPAGLGLSNKTISGTSVLTDTAVSVALEAPIRFSGVLRDGDGVSVPNQLIRLLGPTTNSNTTAADGSFELFVAPDTYTLGVRRSGPAGAATLPDNFDLFGPSIPLTIDTVQDLTLDQVELDVLVLDNQGNPVPGADINVGCTAPSFDLFAGGTTGGGVCGSGITDVTGMGTVILFPASSVTVDVLPPAATGLSPDSVSGLSVLFDTSITVTLVSPIAFSGVLRDRDGTTVPNQLIRLLGSITHSDTTAADGSFSVTSAPGTYSLGVRRSGSGGAAAIPGNFDLFGPSLTLTADTVQDLTLENVFLDVVIQDTAGNPVPGTTVDVGCTNPSFDLFAGGTTSGGVCDSAAADSSGVTRITLFPVSSATVIAIPPAASGLLQRAVTGVAVTEDTQLFIVLQAPNSPPIAVAGPDLTVEATSPAGALVTLDGTASSDPDFDPLTYAWTEGNVAIVSGAVVSVPLSLGVHQITLTVTDSSGASDSDSLVVIVVDTTAPVSTILSAIDGNGGSVPAGGSTLSDVTDLTFGATDAVGVAGFECRLDGAAFSVCSSPQSFVGLATGAHTFEVRAFDASGNVEAPPASFSWGVITPQDALSDLIDDVQDLVNNGSLNGGQGNSLISKLQNAIAKINQGQINTACAQLQAFINQVNAYISAGTLTAAEGQPLIDAALAVRGALPC